VLTYWLGNRKSLYAGGASPTVELDFSKTPGITRLVVGRRTKENFAAIVNVFDPSSAVPAPREYAVQVSCGERRYRGFVRNLVHNDFTTFVRGPCTIPQELLDAASQGTVSKLAVLSSEPQPTPVAEVFISAF
jgi:hypothetical protein